MIQQFQPIQKNKQYWGRVNYAAKVLIHWHQFYEIELVTKGTGTQIINGVEVPLCPGALTLVSPTDFHRLESNTSSPFEILNFCVVQEALSEEMLSLFLQYPPPYFLMLNEEQMKAFSDDFNELQHADITENPLPDAITRRKIELLLLNLITQFSQSTPYPTRPAPQNISHTIMTTIKYIDKHYHEPLRRDQLAELVHMSPSYFGDQFKKAVGISLFDYITDVRMKKAHSMLRHTDEPIHNIVEAVGFNSPSLFYRKFYEYYKILPSDLVKKRKQ